MALFVPSWTPFGFAFGKFLACKTSQRLFVRMPELVGRMAQIKDGRNSTRVIDELVRERDECRATGAFLAKGGWADLSL